MIKFLKNWTLPIAMAVGAVGYLCYAAIPALDSTHDFISKAVAIIQPLLLFCMLLLTFCKVKPTDLRLRGWQVWALLMQGSATILLTLSAAAAEEEHWRVVAESAMLCMICPTATAAAVVTRKLGGNAGTLMMYTLLINLLVAILFPTLLPLIQEERQGFLSAFLRIIARVFPLLLGPFLLSIILRWLSPKITEMLSTHRNLPFYLWAVSLSLAIAVGTKSIVHSHLSLPTLLAVAIVSAAACFIQFAFGRWTGRKWNDDISAAQACGQKNTVLIIWLGYTFMTPVTSIAGAFYSIWHNLYNSWQLKKVES